MRLSSEWLFFSVFICLGKRERELTRHCVGREFLKAEYKTVRDRQMREMEIEDDILSKAPVRFVLLLCFSLPCFSLTRRPQKPPSPPVPRVVRVCSSRSHSSPFFLATSLTQNLLSQRSEISE